MSNSEHNPLENPLENASPEDAWLNLAEDEPSFGVPPCVKRVVICGDQVHIRAEMEVDPAERINVTDARTLMQIVAALETANVRRLFYRPGGTAVDKTLQQSLSEKGIDAIPVDTCAAAAKDVSSTSPSVSSADFMDEDDADLVAQRLRELGYL